MQKIIEKNKIKKISEAVQKCNTKQLTISKLLFEKKPETNLKINNDVTKNVLHMSGAEKLAES